MTNDLKKTFVGERSQALATIILTRRGDLTIVDTKKNTGLDLHVHIDREDKPMRLTFGLLVRGVVSPVSVNQANKILAPTLGQFQGMRKFTYPVCLFFFTMRDDHAYFSWLAETVVNGVTPKLVHRDKADCVELTNELVDRVVEQIVAWYDAVETVLIA